MLQTRFGAPFRYAVWLALFSALVVGRADAQSAAASAVPGSQSGKELHKWFDLETLSISTRYRFVKTANGHTTSNQQQWQFMARGRFKFDRAGRYAIVATLATGNTLTGGWNNTGLGSGDPQSNVFLKQLYVDARPTKFIEAQFGGIGINNGENTEITGYDNDIYITGERIQIRSPKKFYFDEISLTNGFLGDFNRPSVFSRFKHLDKSNYHQFLVRKQVTKDLELSADYTFESGIDTLRQAVKIKFPKSHFLNGLLFENYQRLDPHPGYGFALTGDKKISTKLSFVGGFTKISHPTLNGDRFPQGERIYVGASYKITGELAVNPVVIRAVGPLLSSTIPRTRLDLILSYNVVDALRRYHIF